MTSTINGPQAQKPGKVEPNEIGWLFVPQYYTFVNKDPARLHMFYTKRSTFIHGTEGEDCTPCHGQQEIHNRIMSLGFDDCKVFVSNVDSQASAEGGILVQVLGEMCNAGGPWKKFAQTFFLAEQPNGYFVLNDIFRYIREEGDEPETITEEVVEQAVPEEEPEKPIPQTLVETQVPLTIPPTETENATVAEAEVIPPTEEAIPEPSSAQTNGVPHDEEQEEMINTQVEPEPEQEEEEEIKPEPEPEVEPYVVEQPEEVIPEQPPTPPVEAAPVAAPAPETNVVTPPPPKADPPPPPKPKTWANLAANNSSKWGNAVADTKGVISSTPSTPSAPTPKAQSSSPHSTSNSPQCFVKGITDSINEQALKETLSSRFGTIRSLEVIKPRGCAFLEFQTVDSANKARETSLAENGIKVGDSDTIYVEEKKRKEDRGGPWRGDGTKSPGGRGFGSFGRQPSSGGGFQDGRGGQRGGAGRSRGGR